MSTPTFTATTPQAYDSPRAIAARRALLYSQILIASSAYTSTQTGLTFDVPPGGNLLVWLVCTAASGTGGLTLKIEIQDPTSLVWLNIGQDSAARTSVLNLGFAVGPGAGNSGTLTNSSFVTKQFPVAGKCRVTVSHGDASSYTYSVNALVMGPG